jgi:hypothetical protein
MVMRISLNGIVAAVLLTTGGIAGASQTNESEPNNPISISEYVAVPADGISINGVIGSISATQSTGITTSTDPDLDFFTFTGQAGNVVTLDIDGGIGGQKSVDTVIAIFDGSDFKMLRENDDATSLDPGSTSTYDARIDNFVLPKTGTYIVGVSNYPRYFMDGGDVYFPTYMQTGDYTLVITGVTPAVKQISIEIKPGEDKVAPINPKSRGKIPVALLGSADFDAMSVDNKSLTFGSTGDENSLFKCDQTGEDVNSDGWLDKVCHFNNQDANFVKGDLEGTLKGKLNDGTAFEGKGLLKVVPAKKNL